MKLLKVHGKKVSVILLALALMVTPMLNIVKAADDNEDCLKKVVYLFSYADTMTVAKYPYNEWDTNHDTKGELQFTSLYQAGYGWNPSNLDKYKDKFTNVLLSAYKNNNRTTETTKRYTSQTYDAENYSVDFVTTAANKNVNKVILPDDAKIIKEETLAYWDDAMINADMELEFLNYDKVITNKEKLKASDLLTYDEGNTTYVMHANWTDMNNIAMGSAASVTFPSINQIRAGATGTDGSELTTEAYTAKLKRSLINDSQTTISANTNNDDIDYFIKRTLTPANIKSVSESNWFTIEYNTIPAADGKGEATWIDDDGHKFPTSDAPSGEELARAFHKVEKWVFVPAAYVVTYDDGTCITDIDTNEPGDKQENPDTGIASYAIIGTLLVGAASAYIYARKNNKFNRV